MLNLNQQPGSASPLRVDLSIQRIRSAGLIYDVAIYRTTDGAEELTLKGRYSAICCLYDASQRQDPQVIPIPPSFLEKIEVSP